MVDFNAARKIAAEKIGEIGNHFEEDDAFCFFGKKRAPDQNIVVFKKGGGVMSYSEYVVRSIANGD